MTSRRKQDWGVDRYAALHQGFGWKVPEKFNMAQVCCGRWAQQPQTASHIAIREHVAGQGLGRSWSFAQLQDAANRLSRVLCLLYTSPSPRDRSVSRMPSSA